MNCPSCKFDHADSDRHGVMNDRGGFDGCCPNCGSRELPTKKSASHERLAEFFDTIPESLRVHLSEADVEAEYRHHYGKI